MEEVLKHVPYWILILVLLIILGVRYTAPQVTKAMNSVQQVATPSEQVTRYPILGCSISRVYFGIGWQ